MSEHDSRNCTNISLKFSNRLLYRHSQNQHDIHFIKAQHGNLRLTLQTAQQTLIHTCSVLLATVLSTHLIRDRPVDLLSRHGSKYSILDPEMYGLILKLHYLSYLKTLSRGLSNSQEFCAMVCLLLNDIAGCHHQAGVVWRALDN